MSANITSSLRVAIALTPTRSSAIPLGGWKWAVSASEDCTIRQGDSAVNAALDTAGNFFLGKGVTVEIRPTGASDQYVSCISPIAGGSVYITRMDGAS